MAGRFAFSDRRADVLPRRREATSGDSAHAVAGNIRTLSHSLRAPRSWRRRPPVSCRAVLPAMGAGFGVVFQGAVGASSVQWGRPLARLSSGLADSGQCSPYGKAKSPRCMPHTLSPRTLPHLACKPCCQYQLMTHVTSDGRLGKNIHAGIRPECPKPVVHVDHDTIERGGQLGSRPAPSPSQELSLPPSIPPTLGSERRLYNNLPATMSVSAASRGCVAEATQQPAE